MKGVFYKSLPTFWYLVVFIYKRLRLEHKKVGFKKTRF